MKMTTITKAGLNPLALLLFAAACATSTTGSESDDDSTDDGTGGNGSASVASSSSSVTPVTSSASSSTSATTGASSSSSSSAAGGGGEYSPICDSGFVLSNSAEDQQCAACLGTFCCQEHKDCGSDQNCLDCMTKNQQAACDASIKDESVMMCASDLCSAMCAHLLGG